MLIVKTKEELKQAKDQNVAEFIVVGDLAANLYKSRGIKKLSKKKIIALSGLIGSGIAISPLTGGISLGAASLAAASTAGLSSGAIVAISAIGGILVAYGIHKDYNIKIISRSPFELEFTSTKSN